MKPDEMVWMRLPFPVSFVRNPVNPRAGAMNNPEQCRETRRQASRAGHVADSKQARSPDRTVRTLRRPVWSGVSSQKWQRSNGTIVRSQFQTHDDYGKTLRMNGIGPAIMSILLSCPNKTSVQRNCCEPSDFAPWLRLCCAK